MIIQSKNLIMNQTLYKRAREQELNNMKLIIGELKSENEKLSNF